MEEKIKHIMPTVKELEAIKNRRTIFLVSIEELIRENGRVTIKIADNPEVAFNKATRNILEKVRTEWRWPAGGAAIIINTKDRSYLLTLLRDRNAPTYTGHTTLPTGLGSSIEEMLHPLEIGREAIEEIIIATRDGVIVPTFSINPFGERIDIKSIVKIGADLRPETQNLPLIETSAETIKEFPGEKEVKVVWKNETFVSRGLVVIDEGVRGIDVLQIVEINLGNAKIEDIKIFDGEIAGGNILDRSVIAYELTTKTLKPTGKIVGWWKSGTFSVPPEGTKYPQTPVLQAVMKELALKGQQ